MWTTPLVCESESEGLGVVKRYGGVGARDWTPAVGCRLWVAAESPQSRESLARAALQQSHLPMKRPRKRKRRITLLRDGATAFAAPVAGTAAAAAAAGAAARGSGLGKSPLGEKTYRSPSASPTPCPPAAGTLPESCPVSCHMPRSARWTSRHTRE